jgi:hypothetical protein
LQAAQLIDSENISKALLILDWQADEPKIFFCSDSITCREEFSVPATQRLSVADPL